MKRFSLTQWIVLAAIIVGSFFRLWNFPNTLQFLGDQGRDALVALHIFKDHHFVLIGPVTSTGNMYLGPLYYYFMVPFLYLSYPSPLGPAYAIAALSIATIVLIYYLGKELIGERSAVIASVAFACSAAAVTYARFSWNPNPAPFVSIILIWASYRALVKNPWYFVLVSVCISILIQLHYVTLLTIPAAGIIWLMTLWNIAHTPQKKWKVFFFSTIISVLLFLSSLTPLVLFDLRHQFLNLHALQSFLSQNQGNLTHTTNSLKIIQVAKETDGRSRQVLFEPFIGKHFHLNQVLLAIFLLSFIILALPNKQKTNTGIQVIAVYFFVSIAGLAFYESTIFDHYIAYLFPITMMVYGILMDRLLQHKFGVGVAACISLGYLGWNITHMPLQTIGWSIFDMKRTAQTLIDRVKPGDKYNLVLLTSTGDIEGQNYRYFLETSGKPPLPKERWGETETLFIINEDGKLKKVTDSPIYEIVVFPNKTPAEVYTISHGPQVTVLKK